MITATWDLFPADVTLPDGTQHTGVRVLVTDQGMALVYGAGEGASVVQVWAGPIVDRPELKNVYAPRYDSTSTIPTQDGQVTVTRGAGCGCSSPLRYANLAALGIS